MAIPTPSFLLGIAILAYLGTFVLFALLRIVTGISIQRLGFSGLRRVALNPNAGIRIEIRGIGFAIHRPTFAQPTWISIKITELKLIIDLRTLGKNKVKQRTSRWGVWRGSTGLSRPADDIDDDDSRPGSPLPGYQSPEPEDDTEQEERSRLWKRLTEWKDRIKRLHRKIRWIRMFDVVATESMLVIQDVGTIQVAYFTLAVDTRRKTVDRARLYRDPKTRSSGKKPAEWIMNVRSIFLTPEGKESTEVLNNCSLNIHGFLHQHLDGLRDASIGLKFGRVTIPYDDVRTMADRIKHCRRAYGHLDVRDSLSDITFTDLIEELDVPGSKEAAIARTVSDSKEFVSSILRGIQEIQFAITFLALTKRIRSVQSAGAPVFLNVSMKELGLDLVRLDPRSPAHLMYFSPSDIAHQALIAAIAVSVSIDDGADHPERLLYVPMATVTVRTTLPSKTIQVSEENTFAERNTNILFANLVITSPSVDLDPKHLPLIIALLRQQGRTKSRSPPSKPHRHIISRLLPKTNIKTSIHEPVFRITLPPRDPDLRGTDRYDLLISAMSSVALDVDSSHSAAGELHYSLASNFRISSHQLYYQTSGGEKHSLLTSDSLEARVQLSASPDVAVIASFNAQTFSVHMVRPEISDGVRQIVSQIKNDRFLRTPRTAQFEPRPAPLRKIPAWLLNAQFQGSDFNIEVAGVDSAISSNPKGVAIHLESWHAEYKANRSDEVTARVPRKRGSSRTFNAEDLLLRPSTPKSPRKRHRDSTDGRRLAVHLQGLDGFVIESVETWEPTPFLTLPRFEIAFSTATDNKGPIFHINAFTRALYINYSLHRHFAIDLAMTVLKRAFVVPLAAQRQSAFSRSSSFPLSPTSPTSPKSDSFLSNSPNSPPTRARTPDEPLLSSDSNPASKETVTLDFRAAFIQIKGRMPADPPLMMQIFSLEAGWHRWSPPFAMLRLSRLYTETPNVRGVWSRLVTVKSGRLDFRTARKKGVNGLFVEEHSIDVASEAIRIAIPHGLLLYKVFDNIVNVAKTAMQLHYRSKTQTDKDILDKPPQAPKKVPRISIRSHVLLGEIEDGPFEWKLGVIYRLGLLEQKQRSAREAVFKVKMDTLREAEKKFGAKNRSKSAHERKSRQTAYEDGENQPRRRSKSMSRTRGRTRGAPGIVSYDVGGMCGISDTAKRTEEQSLEALQLLNARSWKARIDKGLKPAHHGTKDIRSTFWGVDEGYEDTEQQECIMSIPQRPALALLQISDFTILIDKPSFPLSDYPNFLYRIGKGMPRDTKYSLLIPMNVHITMGEAKMTLRDYPLPLIHIPAIRPGQSPRLPSVSLKTDFVIAEEYRDFESKRMVDVVVVPPETGADGEQTKGFRVLVPRTISPVKTFSDITMDINTAGSTRIAWGTSYQPAIQDLMQIVENFTKPVYDPSDRVGFWDKMRLCFHSRILVSWKGDGDVHLILKGSRDPYLVNGVGAGFVLCWQNDVRWGIWQENNPKRFMNVDAGVFVLAIPDFSDHVRQVQDHPLHVHGGTGLLNSGAKRSGRIFAKTVMKLTGGVRWMMGFVFERNLSDGGRSFEFEPHYNVILRDPKYVHKRDDGLEYDAYRGFRSHHIHMSIAITAPKGRDWTVSNLKPSSDYNSVHLTPRFFSHFFNWWSMFSGVLSLPVRQGKLWPNAPARPSKKFGRHLATIKYNLFLSPLFMGHIYRHRDGETNAGQHVNATGLKIKIDSFMLDLHQRREQFKKVVQGKQTTTSAIRINQVQLDFIAADVRAVSGTMATPAMDELDSTAEHTPKRRSSDADSVDLSKFTIPDNDLKWIDMDDFRELDWALPTLNSPELKVLPLAFAPRFTYFRQTDHNETISGDPNRTSPFGYEETHNCVMSSRNDPRRVQCDLIQARLEEIDEQIAQNQTAIGEHEVKLVRSIDPEHGKLLEQFEILQEHDGTLRKKKLFLQGMLKALVERLEKDEDLEATDPEAVNDIFFEANENREEPEGDTEAMASAPLADYLSDFNNRFIVHNAQVKWNNALRNIIMRYIHEASQRRGFVYYMSRRAVKFILDIVEEQNKMKTTPSQAEGPISTEPTEPVMPQKDDETNVQDRIRQLLDDTRQFVTADDPKDRAESIINPTSEGGEDLSLDFTAQNTYHFRIVAPQIQLQSDKNPKSAVLITAKGMQMKVIQIMDKDRVADEVSGLVQRRFTLGTDSVQIFVTNSTTWPRNLSHMYSGSRYGAPAGTAWPPWVPLEVMFEFDIDPFGFSRVIQRTSASMRYDKYNNLRLKYNDGLTTGDGDQPLPGAEGSVERRMDHVWVEFPHIRAICDSAQYYALYVIALDLLLYSEPLEKTRNERLEKIMLASDFSDLSGTPEMVVRLQERIRHLQEIKLVFQVREQQLDSKGWRDRIAVEHDLSAAEDDLFFMMTAITTAQRKFEEKGSNVDTRGLLRWLISASEIKWHLIRGKDESLAEIQLQDALFDRVDQNDGSNRNTMEIAQIRGYNLLSNALYREIISPYDDDGNTNLRSSGGKMVRVHWYMLEAIGGIPVMNNFEVNIHPIKLQLEREVGMRFFEYVFPRLDPDAFETGNFSPFLVKPMLPAHEEEDENALSEHVDLIDPPSVAEQLDENTHPIGTEGLESRLHPTLHLQTAKLKRIGKVKGRPLHHLNLHHSSDGSSQKSPIFPHRDVSSDNLSHISRHTSGHRAGSDKASVHTNNTQTDRSKIFTLHRSQTSRSSKSAREDDLSLMIQRASNFMTLAYVKIPSVVLCLSYKGKGQRNFEDVHNLVFRLPTLEYRNKTWSNYDLAMQLKKEVRRALISHVGAIVGNKFTRHKNSRPKEITDSSNLLSTTPNWTPNRSEAASETTSHRDLSDAGMADTDDEYSEEAAQSSRVQSSSASAFAGGSSVHEQDFARDDQSTHSRRNGDDDDQSSTHKSPSLHNSLARRLTGLGKSKEKTTGDDSSSIRRKSKILLGKRFH